MISLDIQRFSGGSYNYGYENLDIYINDVYDDELSQMIEELREVLHDLEWWQSCDIGEEDYRETLNNFKNKWFKNKATIDEIKLENVRKKLKECLKQIGEENE